jgi:peptide-methionine (S)-S-oxide reductase
MKWFIITSLLALSVSCSSQKSDQSKEYKPKEIPQGLSTAYFASGCFWCVEAVYESLKGVEEVISGYAGGYTENPTYRQVGSGRTGHAEAIEVYYDPEIIDFETLVQVYYASQNPTTEGQHPDYGSAYRSIIFYKNNGEKKTAEKWKAEIAKDYDDPIVTEIKAFEVFWPAEEYHQDYEKRNPNQPYVRSVSIPRLKRFQAKHPELLKPSDQ